MGLFAVSLVAAGCSSDDAGGQPARAPTQGQKLLPRIDAALAAAARFLVARQSEDGAWRSETHECFRDGPELTPHVLASLFFLPQGGEAVGPAFDRGVAFMTRLVSKEGKIEPGPRGLSFPVFTAGLASRVAALSRQGAAERAALAAWVAYVRERQFAEHNGWGPVHAAYGGWGFSVAVPRLEKPEPGRIAERFFEANLVATVYGVEALRSARVAPADPACEKALTFVKRCQNFADHPHQADPLYDDGGFFFMLNDTMQNMAGVAGRDRFGKTRFHSYGSMTAAGVRALVACGLPLDHPRVAAARRWLEVNWAVDMNPGTFTKDREVLRNSQYYYYVWSLAQALVALETREMITAQGGVRWGEALAEELIARQKRDGAWRNVYSDSKNPDYPGAKEDDPLVSTPFAAGALAICRAVITGEYADIGRVGPAATSTGKEQ